MTEAIGARFAFSCEICGDFAISETVKMTALSPTNSNLTPTQRASLSHRIRTETIHRKEPPFISTPWLEDFWPNSELPTPATQAANAIRYIGDRIRSEGKKLSSLPISVCAIIGAPSPTLAGDLIIELKDRGLIEGVEFKPINQPPNLRQVNLTLSGWESYEAEKKGKRYGNYGFIAMAFGKPDLDTFVLQTLKPCIKRVLDFEVVDMRDAAKAGIIDNIMREKIRDAAFVLVDLTHDNPGAYWEGGYAEGLGKPVIYICESSKFAEEKTHFDTNHSTTIPWSVENTSKFEQEIIATLRRSLNLF